MVAMGFVGKNIECADELLRESDRDTTERGQRMRQTGLAIVSSLIQALPTEPLQGTGYDLKTGKAWEPEHDWLAPWLRNATEDMRVLMRAYRRERAEGRRHPEWFAWVKQYADWLVQQQRTDGSFPRRWKRASNEVEEASGTTSYNPVPLLVLMSEETGDPKYRQSAIRAAEYVWSNWGTRRLYRRRNRQSIRCASSTVSAPRLTPCASNRDRDAQVFCIMRIVTVAVGDTLLSARVIPAEESVTLPPPLEANDAAPKNEAS